MSSTYSTAAAAAREFGSAVRVVNSRSAAMGVGFVAQALQEKQLRSRLLLQVHDELVLEVVEEERLAVAALVKEKMEQAVCLQVPLLVDVHYGVNWAQAK